MSFWKSQSGAVIDGSEEHSHTGSFKIIPDGTTAPAVIKEIEFTEFDGKEHYQVSYQLVSGDYKGQMVRQKIHCFDADSKKRDRAVNMLMRLHKLCNVSPAHSDAPTSEDLLPLKNRVIGIKIQEWFANGKEGNWVSAIYPVDEKFVTETGVKLQHVNEANYNEIDSALNRNAKSGLLDDDVPF